MIWALKFSAEVDLPAVYVAPPVISSGQSDLELLGELQPAGLQLIPLQIEVLQLG
jgi:hypothetical protein